jgi:hypothetical protein
VSDLLPVQRGPSPMGPQPAQAPPTGEGPEAIIQSGTPDPFQPGQIEGSPELPPWLTDAEETPLDPGGPRRQIGPRGHSMGAEHPLSQVADDLRAEIERNAPRMASALFPQGPADSVLLAKPALNAYVRRHWNDPGDPEGSKLFRKSLLDQMAPKGPNGARLEKGVENFLKLYREAILEGAASETPGPKITDPEPLPRHVVPRHPEPVPRTGLPGRATAHRFAAPATRATPGRGTAGGVRPARPAWSAPWPAGAERPREWPPASGGGAARCHSGYAVTNSKPTS